ncbi:small ubiquitin-related modifier 1-like isoform X2 [Silene latifolia]|uniref:small ubiquitin-related modifier 1-like isoform X2 n=1 Tax=Silene latifolia TaxID=37657 RepID=UPI003D76F0F9
MASNGIINPNQIRHEIETLKSQKQKIEARISLLQSQLLQQHSSCTNNSCPPISAVQGTREEDNKQGERAAYIKLKVSGEDGDEVVRMKRSSKFKKLLYAYCDLKSVDFESIVFLLYGRHVHPRHTPDQLEMEDGDEIYVFFKLPREDYV